MKKKFAELTEEELSVVTGGYDFPAFGKVTIEVGKWYRMNDTRSYEFRIPEQSTCRWYCAEDLGGNRFRFEGYVWAPLSSGNGVSYLCDSVSSGAGYEECPAPFPLPGKFTGNP